MDYYKAIEGYEFDGAMHKSVVYTKHVYDFYMLVISFRGRKGLAIDSRMTIE